MSDIIKFEELQKYADIAFKSRLYADLNNAEQAFVKMQTGAEYGLKPLQSLGSFDIIPSGGKMTIAIRSNFLAARVKGSGRYNYKVLESDSKHCKIQFLEKFNDNFEIVGTSEFNEVDANRAGLLGKNNWKQYPVDMYYRRALARGVRQFCPDLFYADIYLKDEIEAESAKNDGGSEIKNIMQAAKTAPEKVIEVIDVTPDMVVDTKTGEITERKAMGYKELIEKLRLKALKIRDLGTKNDLRITDATKKLLIFSIGEVIKSAEQRHRFYQDVFGIRSMNELYEHQARAILAWIGYPAVYTPDWDCAEVVKDEFSEFENEWINQDVAMQEQEQEQEISDAE